MPAAAAAGELVLASTAGSDGAVGSGAAGTVSATVTGVETDAVGGGGIGGITGVGLAKVICNVQECKSCTTKVYTKVTNTISANSSLLSKL